MWGNRIPYEVGKLYTHPVGWSIPTVDQSGDKDRNLHFSGEVYQMGSGFPQVCSYQCSLFAPIARSWP